MSKYFTILILITFYFGNISCQEKYIYNDNLIASNIRNEIVRFENDKDRVFVIVSGLSCSNCLKHCAYTLNELRPFLKDSCDFILIMQGSPQNVLGNRNRIKGLSEIFNNMDHYLFDFNLENGSALDVSKYQLKDFPVVIISTKSSENIWVINYSEKSMNDFIETFKNLKTDN